ncbi:sporulation YhaL family protein [Jeotgalibacillus marinus]|uniref:Sporulation YhaL family protein n=1 Tax=Jeotgalibacillus marinus TaxID=86667 RepID=A0ABV3Q2Y7_9BACL
MFPLWIDLTIVGIVLSALMMVRAAYAEKKVENEWIEEHGQTYIKRMVDEKAKRRRGMLTREEE